MKKLHSTTTSTKAKVRFSLLDADNVVALARTCHVPLDHLNISVADFISLGNLQDPDLHLLPNNTLSIQVDITLLSKPTGYWPLLSVQDPVVTALVAGMNNKLLTDCVLQCQELALQFSSFSTSKAFPPIKRSNFVPFTFITTPSFLFCFPGSLPHKYFVEYNPLPGVGIYCPFQ